MLNAAMRSETLKGYPYIRQQTLVILRELTSPARRIRKDESPKSQHSKSRTSAQQPGFGSEWVAEERDRLEKDFEARRRSTEKNHLQFA